MQEEIDEHLYLCGWILLILFGITLLALKFEWFPSLPPLSRCALHQYTGYYCPGCGGSRAILALFSGHLLKSLYYHPAVPYTAVVGGWFMISRTLQKLSRNKLRIGMHFRLVYVWILLALILGNWLVKNLILICTGIPPI